MGITLPLASVFSKRGVGQTSYFGILFWLHEVLKIATLFLHSLGSSVICNQAF
jgi:hypothetical protein